MKDCLSHLKKYQAPLLTGLLIGTSYIPFPPWAIFFGFSFLWFFLFKCSEDKPCTLTIKQVFLTSWFAQFLFTLIGFHWVAGTAHEFGYLPWILAIPVLILFAMFIHLYIPLSAVIWWRVKKYFNLGPLASLLSLACIHFLMETFWPSIFPWNLGYSWLWAQWPGAQMADTIGFQGLSLVTYIINALIAYAYWQSRTPLEKKPKARRHMITAIATASLLFLTFQFWGYQKQLTWSRKNQSQKTQLNILQVQANIGNLMKVYAQEGEEFRSYIVNKFMTMTREGIDKHPETQLILWPETAFPVSFDKHRHLRRLPSQLKLFVKQIQIPLLTGAYSKDLLPNEEGEKKTSNGLFYLDKNGELISTPYRKHILLPWGEYAPFGDIFPFLYYLLPFSSPFGKGIGAKTFVTSDNIKIGPSICYESLFPLYMKKFADKGAEIFINHANDSWLGQTFEPYQNSYMTMARAIEFRRPLIRNTNTGISGAILADGTILQSSPIGEEWMGFFEIPYITPAPITFYQKYGYRLPWVLLFSLLAFLALKKYRDPSC